MITTDEIIDLIRTGYIPPDPGRLGEFGRVLEALNAVRSPEPLGATYEEIRKARCEWCENGWPIHEYEDGPHHFQACECSVPTGEIHPCTAPTPEQMFEEQAREIRRLQAELKRDEDAAAVDHETITELRAQLAAAQVERDAQADLARCAEARCRSWIDERNKAEQASEARGQEVERLRGALSHILNFSVLGIGLMSGTEYAKSVAAGALLPCATPATPAVTPAVACGCIPCRCEHETQCQGCGAKMCDQHKAERAATPAPPEPVLINCPACNVAHIDEGEWATRPHKTHQCQNCKHEWRPFSFPTVGIATPAVEQSDTVQWPRLFREEWGIVMDALIEHRQSSDRRKSGNSESTSDERADMCVDIIRRIGDAARSAEAKEPGE